MKVYLMVLAIGLSLPSCLRCSPSDETSTAATDDRSRPSSKGDALPETKNNGKLEVKTLREGGGVNPIKSGQKATVHYKGWLPSGEVFDSSEERGAPFSFVLGSGHVIQGWELGVSGMTIGERRRLSVPSQQAYGEKGVNGIIPPNTNLVFEIELLAVE
jgi:FKBP-type peptidyl-prolyl cis-trans isomerase